MATIAPKRGFSVVTVAKAAQLLCYLCKGESIYKRFRNLCSFYTERKSHSERDIRRNITKLHLRGVVKVSAIIKAAVAFVLLCIFEFAATAQWRCLLKCLIDFYCMFLVS